MSARRSWTGRRSGPRPAAATPSTPSRPEPGPGRPVGSGPPQRNPLPGPGPRAGAPGPEPQGADLRVVLVSRDNMLAGALRSLIEAPGGVRMLDWHSQELDAAIGHADVVIIDMPPNFHQRTFAVLDGRFLGRIVVLLQEGEHAEALPPGPPRVVLYRPLQIGELWSAIIGATPPTLFPAERPASAEQPEPAEADEAEVGERGEEPREAEEQPAEPEDEEDEFAAPGDEQRAPSEEAGAPGEVREPGDEVGQPGLLRPGSEAAAPGEREAEPAREPVAAADAAGGDAGDGPAVEQAPQGLPVAESGRLIGLSGRELEPTVGPGQVAPGMDEATLERLRRWRTSARQLPANQARPTQQRGSTAAGGEARTTRAGRAEARRSARAEAKAAKAAQAEAREAARAEAAQAKAAQAEAQEVARAEARRAKAAEAQAQEAARAEARRQEVAEAEARQAARTAERQARAAEAEARKVAQAEARRAKEAEAEAKKAARAAARQEEAAKAQARREQAAQAKAERAQARQAARAEAAQARAARAEERKSARAESRQARKAEAETRRAARAEARHARAVRTQERRDQARQARAVRAEQRKAARVARGEQRRAARAEARQTRAVRAEQRKAAWAETRRGWAARAEARRAARAEARQQRAAKAEVRKAERAEAQQARAAQAAVRRAESRQARAAKTEERRAARAEARQARAAQAEVRRAAAGQARADRAEARKVARAEAAQARAARVEARKAARGEARQVRAARAEARKAARTEARQARAARAEERRATRAETGRARAAQREEARAARTARQAEARAAKAVRREETSRARAAQREESRFARAARREEAQAARTAHRAEAQAARTARREKARVARNEAREALARRVGEARRVWGGRGVAGLVGAGRGVRAGVVGLARPVVVVVVLAAVGLAAAGWRAGGGPDTLAGEVATVRAGGAAEGGLVAQDPRGGPIEPLHALAVGAWLRVSEAGSSIEAAVRAARAPSRWMLAVAVALTVLLSLLLMRVGPGSGAAAGPGPAPPQPADRPSPGHRSATLRRLVVAAAAGALVALDPLVVRGGRAATGTVLALALALGALALAWAIPSRPALRWLPAVAAAGGLALLVSPLALPVLVVPTAAALLQGRYQEAWRTTAALGLAVGIWLLLPVWAAGQDLSAGQAGWLLGRPPGRGSLAASLAASPLSWLLVAAGLAAAILTWRPRSGARSAGAATQASWRLAWVAATTLGALAAMALGYPVDRALPYAVPAAAVALAFAAGSAVATARPRARRLVLAGTGVALAGLLVAQGVDWGSRYGGRADDGLGRLVATVAAQVPACSAVNAAGPDERARLLAAGVNVTDFTSGPAAHAAGVRYFVLTGDTGGGPATPGLAGWVRQRGDRLAELLSRSFPRVELWRVDAAPLDPVADRLPVPGGIFSNVAGSACGGYRVVDRPEGAFHAGYQAAGGKAVLGRPLGSVWTSDGPALQAFDTMVLGAAPAAAAGQPAVRPIELPPLLAKLNAEAVADADIPLPSVRPPASDREARALLEDRLIARAYLDADPATATAEDWRRARERFGRPLGRPQVMPDGAVRQPFERVVLELPADGGAVRPAALGRLAVRLGLVPRQATRLEPVPGLPAGPSPTPLDPGPLLRWVAVLTAALVLASGLGAVAARRTRPPGPGRGGPGR